MTTPLSPHKIDDLLSELQNLETRQSSPGPVSFIPVPPPKIVEAPSQAPLSPVKEGLKMPEAYAVKKESSKGPNTFAVAAICSLLFFTLGLFSADFFITGTEETASEPAKINFDLSDYHPEIAALYPQLQKIRADQRETLLKAIDEGQGDLNKKALDSKHMTSLALLHVWHDLKKPELRNEFQELAVKEGLGAFLPAQVTQEEKLRPLYYLSDSPLHINLSKLHQNILHDIP